MTYKMRFMIFPLLAVFVINMLVPAYALQNTVNVALPVEESMTDAAVDEIVNNITEERDRLLVRLQANSPDQTQGSITTSLSELAGQMIANAMRHLIVVQPNGQPVVIAIAPQSDPDGTRQLVLINLTAWINNGRLLGMDQMETFAILPDVDMRQPSGSSFEVGGVGYVGKVAEGSFSFHRVQ